MKKEKSYMEFPLSNILFPIGRDTMSGHLHIFPPQRKNQTVFLLFQMVSRTVLVGGQPVDNGFFDALTRSIPLILSLSLSFFEKKISVGYLSLL